jgi:hypothetical protein
MMTATAVCAALATALAFDVASASRVKDECDQGFTCQSVDNAAAEAKCTRDGGTVVTKRDGKKMCKMDDQVGIVRTTPPKPDKRPTTREQRGPRDSIGQ